MTPTPLALSRVMSPNKISVSRSVSDAVGSSRMRTRKSPRIALAISTSCCSPRDSCETGRSRSMPRSSAAKSASALRRPSPRRRKPADAGSSPRTRFSRTV